MQTIILAAGPRLPSMIDNNYPGILTEFSGKPMIQGIVEDLNLIPNNRIFFVVNHDELERFHIDQTLKLIDPTITIVAVHQKLGGAACSALLALQETELNEEILILNGNEKITENHDNLLQRIKKTNSAACVVCFDSAHPRYSFAKVDEDENVLEISEKMPISRNALVGFFWFSSARLVENAIKEMILRDTPVNEIFYLAPAINELILQGEIVKLIRIDNSKFYPMKSDWQLNEYQKK